MPSSAVRPAVLALLGLAAAASLGASCAKKPRVVIDAPVHGEFVTGSTVTVTGRALRAAGFQALSVNGVPVPAFSGSEWSVDVPVDPAEVFAPLEARLVLASGEVLRDRVTVVAVDGTTTQFVPDGALSPEAVGLRLAEGGLASVAAIVERLSSDALDVGSLILGQNPIAEGSQGGIDYVANAVDVSLGGFALSAEPSGSGLDTTIALTDFFLELDLELGILGGCTLEITTSSASIEGTFDLAPLAADPSRVDVRLVSPVAVVLGGFSSQFVSGACNDPLIGDIVDLILSEGDVQALMQDGFAANLADPDGAGPQDSPLAAAIEEALGGVSIAGPIGDALESQVEAPIASIAEDGSGLTLAADVAITAASPHPDAPDLPGSLAVAEPFPTLGATTPGGLPYGLAFVVSTSGLNQLLKAQIENGLLQSEITEFQGLPLTAGLMSLFVPELAGVDPSEPIVIRIRPTLAPVFTGAPGPAGELAELKIAALSVSMEFPALDQAFLVLEVSLDAGVDLAFTEAGLEFTLATPDAADIEVAVSENTIGTDEPTLVSLFQQVFPLFAPELENAIEAFPLPSLLGLDLAPVEVARLPGGPIGLFADLVAEPTSEIANVVFTDLSTGDFVQQGGCWLREWRHRLSGSGSATGIQAQLKGMLGADAGCTTNDAQSVATAAWRVAFDVVGVAGEQWTLAIDHSLLGAFDRISDGYNDGIGFQDGGGAAWLHTPVRGSWAVTGGGSGDFDFAAVPDGLAWDGIGGPSSSEHVELSGSAGTVLTGTGDAHVELEFSFEMEAFSDSNTAFPTANGDELAIRLGKNDTIDDNFTAGSYPGAGGRDLAADGHRLSVELSVAPAP